MSKSPIRTDAYIQYLEPRLSALTLAQYCTSSNAKQRADIRQSARYLRVAGIMKNTESRRAFRRYLNDTGRDPAILDHALKALQTKVQSPFTTDFQRETALKNIENLQRFVNSEKSLGLGNYGFDAAPSKQPQLILADVPVSVDLDWLVVAGPDKEDRPQTGGAMIQLAKGAPLPDAAKRDGTREKRLAARVDINRFMAVLIHQHLAQNFPEIGTPVREKCFVIDPYVPSTTAVHGRLDSQVRQMEEAVMEIAERWDTIKPPSDYDG